MTSFSFCRWHFSGNYDLVYEEMKKDLASVIRKIANFLGKEITEENVAKIVEFTNIDNMKKNPMSNMEERINVRV